MKMGGEEYDSHPELTEVPGVSPSSEGSSESLIALGLVVVLIVGAVAFVFLNNKYRWAFKPK